MIDTYGMDDINTQAIRELTTEVERVKLKQKSQQDAIDVLNSLPSYKIVNKLITLSDALNIEGSSSTPINIPLDSVEGYTPIFATITRNVTAGGTVATSIVVTQNYIASADTTKVQVNLFNAGVSSVTVKYIDICVFYVSSEA